MVTNLTPTGATSLASLRSPIAPRRRAAPGPGRPCLAASAQLHVSGRHPPPPVLGGHRHRSSRPGADRSQPLGRGLRSRRDRVCRARAHPGPPLGRRRARARRPTLERLRPHRPRPSRHSRNGQCRLISTLQAPSTQWASRPDDQRYLSLDDLAAAVGARRDLSRASNVRLDSLTIDNDQDGQILLTPPDGQPVPFTNWSFGQLASLVGARPRICESCPHHSPASTCNTAPKGPMAGARTQSCSAHLSSRLPTARFAPSPTRPTAAFGTPRL